MPVTLDSSANNGRLLAVGTAIDNGKHRKLMNCIAEWLEEDPETVERVCRLRYKVG